MLPSNLSDILGAIKGDQLATTFQVRLTEGEKATIKKVSGLYGLNPSAYIRALHAEALKIVKEEMD